MHSMINFLLESVISLSLLVTVYLLFLKEETFLKLNRIFLLSSLLFSLVLPIVKIKLLEPQPIMLQEITVTPYRNMFEAVNIYGKDFSMSVEQVLITHKLLIWIYIIGLCLLLFQLIFRLIQIRKLIRKHLIQPYFGAKLVLMDQDYGTFSFLNYIFINRKLIKSDDFNKIAAHELEHIKQGHTWDILFLEFLVALQWFNPFVWILRSVVRENHEYLADRAVLASGVSRGYYKQLLMNQFTGEQILITNNFNYSMIKNRIKMMSKIKSSKIASLKYLPGLLLAVILTLVFACEQKEVSDPTIGTESGVLNLTIIDEDQLKIEGNAVDIERVTRMMSGSNEFDLKNDSNGYLVLLKKKNIPRVLTGDEQIFFIVEDMPEFPGGESALRQFIANNIKYPEVAQQNGIEGRVYVTFVVDNEGNIANAKIARGVDPSLDMEALRVVNSLPKWKPGYQRGQPVNVSYTVPINFALQ